MALAHDISSDEPEGGQGILHEVFLPIQGKLYPLHTHYGAKTEYPSSQDESSLPLLTSDPPVSQLTLSTDREQLRSAFQTELVRFIRDWSIAMSTPNSWVEPRQLSTLFR